MIFVVDHSLGFKAQRTQPLVRFDDGTDLVGSFESFVLDQNLEPQTLGLSPKAFFVVLARWSAELAHDHELLGSIPATSDFLHSETEKKEKPWL